ncbi:MAG: tRNA (adenosine(37)-N6)-threonylcarbamoyltransferase complex dimerization subunit type 1 TsaB [Planctomycetota bacterium]
MTARVLGIDVSGPAGGAALVWPAGVVVETIPPAIRRGRDLVPRIERMLVAAGLGPGDLDLIACGVGPGSFTGIRIGIATAATLAYAARVPVLDVGSLHGIAANAPADAEHVLVALDARRGHVFAGLFRRGTLQGAYRNVEPAALAADLAADTWVLGDARETYPEVLGRFPGTADAPVRPDAIARLAAARFEEGERKRPEELRPIYLRLSDPEIRRMM